MKHIKLFESWVESSNENRKDLPEYYTEQLVKWNGKKYALEFGRYRDNDKLAITLIDPKNGEPAAVATVNLVGETVDPKNIDQEIAIKDYSENEGILAAMVDAEIISKPVRTVRGFPIVHLLHHKIRIK